MSGLDDLLKGSTGGGSGGLGDLLGGILGGGQQGSSLGAGGGMGGNPLLKMLLPMIAGMLMNGGLQKIMAKLQQQGKGAQAQSWVGTGANEPVDPADVREALEPGELDQIAQQLGVSPDEAAQAVAQVLPEVVDKASPDGELPSEDELNEKFGRLHELGRAS